MLSREAQTLTAMVSLYCRKNHGGKTLCPECQNLQAYALERLERCKFGADKPTCQKCPIHCYKPEMREKIRQVMRFSGPRLMFYHPIMALRHLFHK